MYMQSSNTTSFGQLTGINMSNETAEFRSAMDRKADQYIPACGGLETPFETRTGRRLLYCYNPQLHNHAYLDVASDIILSNEEAGVAMGIY